MVGHRARNADRAVLAQRHIDRPFRDHRVVVAVAGGGVGGQLADLRLRRQHVDRAARRVAAVQRALRAFEDLHPLQIVEHAGGAGGTADINAIIVERDRGIAVGREREIADAAHAAGLGDAGGGEVGAGDDVDGDGRALQVLCAALCGDDDVAQPFARRRLAIGGRLRRARLRLLRRRRGGVGARIGRQGLCGRGRRDEQHGRCGQQREAHGNPSPDSSALRPLCCGGCRARARALGR